MAHGDAKSSADLSTAPLLPSRALEPTTPTRLLWYHYAILVCLVAYTVAGFVAALRSLTCFLLSIVSFAIIGFLMYTSLRLKPAIIPMPFMISQLGTATLDTPFNLAVMLFVILLAVVLIFTLYGGCILGLYYLMHRDSAQVLISDLSAYAASFNFDWDELNKITVDPIIDAYFKVWTDMLYAGASRPALYLFVAVVLILSVAILCFGTALASAGALEYLKWKALTRSSILPGAPKSLGVNGAVSVSVTSSIAFILFLAFTTLGTVPPTASSVSVFVVSLIIDAFVLASSQLLVAAAYAELHILEVASSSDVHKAIRSSVLFNFSMLLFRALPLYRFVPQIFVSNFAVFVICTVIRLICTFLFAAKAHDRYLSAIASEQMLKSRIVETSYS